MSHKYFTIYIKYFYISRIATQVAQSQAAINNVIDNTQMYPASGN